MRVSKRWQNVDFFWVNYAFEKIIDLCSGQNVAYLYLYCNSITNIQYIVQPYQAYNHI